MKSAAIIGAGRAAIHTPGSRPARLLSVTIAIGAAPVSTSNPSSIASAARERSFHNRGAVAATSFARTATAAIAVAPFS